MKYRDGDVVNGRIVVILRRTAAGGPAAERSEKELAQAQAASMAAAAADGVPFCEKCSATRSDLQQQLERAR